DAAIGFSGYRTGKITIGGQVFSIEQAGNNSESCLPKSITPGREEREFLRPSDCPSRIRTDAFYIANRWSFAAKAGERFAISLRSGSSNNRLHISLLDPDGRVLTQAAMGENDRMLRVPAGDGVFFAPVAGTYVIEVTPLIAGGGGEYFLRLNLQSDCGDCSAAPMIRRRIP